MKHKYCIILLALFILAQIGCDETNEIIIPGNITVTPGETNAEVLTKAGWRAFEKSNFSSAVDSFLLAIDEDNFYGDAYNGLGWSYARLDCLDLARDNFTIAKLSFNESNDFYRDASAGRAFVNLSLDEYLHAIDDVNSALRWQYYSYQDYVFRHDLSITELDLLLVKAECYFLLEDYIHCRETLLHIDETLVLDYNNPEQLAAAIENLKGMI